MPDCGECGLPLEECNLAALKRLGHVDQGAAFIPSDEERAAAAVDFSLAVTLFRRVFPERVLTISMEAPFSKTLAKSWDPEATFEAKRGTDAVMGLLEQLLGLS
ncbi:MAG: hypothetical protein ACXU82_03940 [Caulobacteraceae bacterium]